MEKEIQSQPQELNPIPPNNKNRIIIIAIIAIALIVIGGYFIFINTSTRPAETQTQQLPQNIDTSKGKIYTLERYGFEFKYPNDWIVPAIKNSVGSHTIVYIMRQDYMPTDVGGSLAPTFSIMHYDGKNEVEPISKFIQALPEEIKLTQRSVIVADQTITEKDYASFAAEAATDITYTIEISNNKDTFLFLFTYTLAGCSNVSKDFREECNNENDKLSKDSDKAWNQILSTFKFTAKNQNSQNITEGCVITPYNGEKLEFGDVVSDVRGGAICHFNIHSSLPTYNFYLRGNAEYNTIDQIEITKGIESKLLVQKLEVGMGEPPYRDAKFFVAEDMNFDGYKDIKLMSFWGATGNTGYTYWLFDSSKNLFVENKDLSSLSNPVPDVGTKTIATHSVGGMAGCIYNNGTYKFDETGKLILIREEKQDWVEASKSFLKTISELKNGKMVVSTEVGKCDNF